MDLRNTPFLQGFMGATSPAGYQAMQLQRQQLAALEQQRAWEQQFREQQALQQQAQFSQQMANADRQLGVSEQGLALRQAGQAFDQQQALARITGNESIAEVLQQQLMPRAGEIGSPLMGAPDPNPPPPPQFNPGSVANASPGMQQAALQAMLQHEQQKQNMSRLAATLHTVREMGGDMNHPAVRAMMMNAMLGDSGVTNMPKEFVGAAAGFRDSAEMQAFGEHARGMNRFLDDSENLIRNFAFSRTEPWLWNRKPYAITLPDGRTFNVNSEESHAQAFQFIQQERAKLLQQGQHLFPWQGQSPMDQGAGIPYRDGMGVMPQGVQPVAAPNVQNTQPVNQTMLDGKRIADQWLQGRQ